MDARRWSWRPLRYLGPWNFGSWSAIQAPPLPPAVIYGVIFDPSPPQFPTPPSYPP